MAIVEKTVEPQKRFVPPAIAGREVSVDPAFPAKPEAQARLWAFAFPEYPALLAKRDEVEILACAYEQGFLR